MVVALGPGKFYGSSLPRPRFYTDVKFNDTRVDPPPTVNDPLLEWAQEAHWSMGGTNFKRHRLQGRIEGNVEKLRVQREQIFKKSQKEQKASNDSTASRLDKDKRSSKVSETKSPSPPPAPVAIKRRRVLGLMDVEEEDVMPKRGAVRKLGDDFERVARESGIVADDGGVSGVSVAARTRSRKNEADLGSDKGNRRKRKLVKGGKKVDADGVRTSPRLAKSSALH